MATNRFTEMTSDKRREIKRRGPESVTWDQFKGESVRIWSPGVTDVIQTWVGILKWVDRYSIGVSFQQGSISIIHKGPGLRIDPVAGQEINDGDGDFDRGSLI